MINLFRKKKFICLAIALLITTILTMLVINKPLPIKTKSILSLQSPQTLAPTVNTEKKINNYYTITIKPGDNLFAAFKRNQLPASSVYQLLKDPLAAKYLSNIHPNDTIFFKLMNNQLIELNYPISHDQTLHVTYNNSQLHSQLKSIPLEIRQLFFDIAINHSLSRDLNHAGVSNQIIAKVNTIFSNNFNFKRSLKKGDHMQLIIEEIQSGFYAQAKQTAVLAARLKHGKKNITALQFIAPNGKQTYYTPQGMSLEPPFLRYPLKYSYISSPFTLHRKHPILGITRPHYGVDLAAPLGRPIHSTSDGQIYLIGKDRGYGNTIKIKNTPHYSTVYAHLSRFAKGLKRWSWVKKGQIIGYVGSTGLSTGPHLHYEVRIDGVAHDPLKVKLPNGLPIPKRYLQDFLLKAKQLQIALNKRKSTRWVDITNRQNIHENKTAAS